MKLSILFWNLMGNQTTTCPAGTYFHPASLHFYRERLLTATHDREMVYPVIVTATALVKTIVPPEFAQGLGPDQRLASSDDELIRVVGDVLRSPAVVALIHSLLARINGNSTDRMNSAVSHERSDEGVKLKYRLPRHSPRQHLPLAPGRRSLER